MRSAPLPIGCHTLTELECTEIRFVRTVCPGMRDVYLSAPAVAAEGSFLAVVGGNHEDGARRFGCMEKFCVCLVAIE